MRKRPAASRNTRLSSRTHTAQMSRRQAAPPSHQKLFPLIGWWERVVMTPYRTHAWRSPLSNQ